VYGGLVLALSSLVGCAHRNVNYPWARNAVSQPAIAEANSQAAPATEPAATVTEPSTAPAATAPVAAPVEPPMPATAPTPTPAPSAVATEPATAPAASTEPVPPVVPAPELTGAVTSNGADLLQRQAPPPIRVDETSASPLKFSATGLYMWGSTVGHLQIPNNSKVGTSNAGQPRLSRIGIGTASIEDGEIAAKWTPYGEIFAGAQIIQLSGTGFVGNPGLVTDGVDFPASSRVSSNVGLNWYRLGYRYPFVIDIADNGRSDLTFTPWISAVAMDFHYHLTAPLARVATRQIFAPGVQIGATFAWRPNGGPLSLEAQLGGWPTTPNLPTYSVENLYLRYEFYKWRRFDFTGLLGVAFEQQLYRDDGKLATTVSANFGPMIMAGVQVGF
jgi:hypothetical protein